MCSDVTTFAIKRRWLWSEMKIVSVLFCFVFVVLFSGLFVLNKYLPFVIVMLICWAFPVQDYEVS